MTTQETIQAMKFYKAKLYNGIFNDKIGAFDVAISALEKQIPKKVKITIIDDFDISTLKPYQFEIPLCSVCGEKIGLRTHKYCPTCGQALDWSDTK